MLDKEIKNEFVITELLNRIVNLKKRLDQLMFIFLFTLVFAIYNQTKFDSINIFMGLIIKDDMSYHIIISLVLTILFAMIGSHLIEYCAKRARIDSRLIDDNYFEKDYEISRTIIPTSFYEFMYGLFYPSKYKNIENEDIKDDPLRVLSSYALLLSFYIGHLFSFIHLFIAFENKFISATIILVIATLLFFLYKEFVKSLTKANDNLGLVILKMIKYILVLFVLLTLLFIIFNVYKK
ncbi:MAG: hypothetical protein ACYC01_07825 [Lutibacter sp.]